MTIESDSNGNGAFVLQMPKSLYNRTMEEKNGTSLAVQFTLLGTGVNSSDAIDYSRNKTNFYFNGDMIKCPYIQDNPYKMELLFRPHPER